MTFFVRKGNFSSMTRLREHHLIHWVQRFMEHHHLASSQDHVLVGLSGGPDSMLLGHVAYTLAQMGVIKSVRFLHIDHGLRTSSYEESLRVRRWCEERGWQVKVVKIAGEVVRGNIELWGREQRQRLFKKELERVPGSILFLGHHIDDSFEWFMKQLLGSAKVPKAYGIPVRNGNIRRPLHCLSRKHIQYWVDKLAIPCVIDSSNQDERFERNAIRKNVKESAQMIFPKGMANFVVHANEWAQGEGATSYPMRFPFPGVCFLELARGKKDFIGCDQQVAKIIKKLSLTNRGELRSSIVKLIQAQKVGRKGPMNFSGGVQAYMYAGLIIFCNRKGLEQLRELDKSYARQLLLDESQIPDSLEPFVLKREKYLGLESLKKDPLFVEFIGEVHKKGWWVRPRTHVEMTKNKSAMP